MNTIIPKTVHYCCVCKRNSKRDKNLSFFRFPRDEERFAEWKANLQVEKILNHSAQYCYDHFRVCSLHFEGKMFAGMLKSKLKKTAVPLQLKELRELNVLQEGASACKQSTEEIEPVAGTSQEYISKECGQDDISISEADATEEIHMPSTVSTVEILTCQQDHDSKAIQTSQKLTCGTPRKVELRHTIRNLKRKLSTSQKSTPGSTHSEVNVENVTKFLEERISPNLANFLRTQLTLATRSPKGSRYSNEYKQFALTVHFLGPKVYKFLSKMFRLPSRSTLQRITAKWDIRPGFSQFLFEALKLKAAMLDDSAKECILCLDEMSLKSHLFYNLSQDEIIGFHQTSSGRTFQPAQNVLVLMARGINANWKQPLAYFFVNSSCPVEDMKDIIFEAIRKIKGVGLNVLSVISDHGSNFFKLIKVLGVSVNKPYFICDTMKIFYIVDIPHLLKSTRNNFFNYNFKFGGGKTDKKYLEEFYSSDKQEKFRLAPKLTDIHIYPNNFQKMRVKYAAQVFSATVSAAMNAYISFKKLPLAAFKTVEFIEKMNNLFDLFNSSKFHKAKSFNRPFMGTDTQIQFLKDMLGFFDSLVVLKQNKDITKRMKFTYGWKLSIAAFLQMWDILKEKQLHKIHTRRLNQDCLENFFGKIRQQSGNCRNPTPIQFQRAFKKMFGISYLDNSEGTNCLDEFDKILAMITPEVIENCQILIQKPRQIDSLKVEAKDYTNLDITEKNGFVYVGGYFMKKILEKHKCVICLKFGTEQADLDESTIYSFFRAYPNANNDTFGNLKMPNILFLEYIHALENCFCELFENFATKGGIGKNIKDCLSKIEFSKPCQDFPIDYFLSLFVRVRLYYTIKFMNQNIKSTGKNKPNMKLTILKHS